jgi:hypothetical protein
VVLGVVLALVAAAGALWWKRPQWLPKRLRPKDAAIANAPAVPPQALPDGAA